MFGKLMNSFYYGKSGKGDYRKEDLPKNRWQLFFEMLRIRFSALIRLNLMYMIVWLPAMIVLMIASIWQNFGINMLFFMTGLQSISPEMYEAASIDGASNTRQFFQITIPLLGPVLQMVLMNAILGSLKVTDLVLTLTNGNPSGKTEVMMTYIYKQFFGQGGSTAKDYGYGAALTVVTAVILMLVTLVYLKATKKSSEVY